MQLTALALELKVHGQAELLINRYQTQIVRAPTKLAEHNLLLKDRKPALQDLEDLVRDPEVEYSPQRQLIVGVTLKRRLRRNLILFLVDPLLFWQEHQLHHPLRTPSKTITTPAIDPSVIATIHNSSSLSVISTLRRFLQA